MGDYSYTYGYPMYDPYASMPETPTPLPNPAGVTQAPMLMPQVPNVMTGLNSFVDGLFGGSRNAAGSFDPNKVSVPGAAVGKGAGPGNAQPSNPNAWMDKYGFDPETRKMMEFQQELAQRQADVYRRNKPDTSNFNLGNIFTGLGAVAYMTSKNPQVWSHSQAALGRMQQGNEDRARAGRAYDAKLADIEAGAIGSGGDMAVKMMMKQREKRDAALASAAEMVRKADPENRAAILEAAASELEAQGYHAEARQFRERARSSLGSRGEAQPSRQPSPSAGNMVLGAEPALEGMRGTQKVSPPADPAGVAPPGQQSYGSIYGRHEPRIRELRRQRNLDYARGADTKRYDDEIATIGNIVQEEMKPGRQLSPEERRDLVGQMGMDPESDAARSYILTGKLPREDQQMLTATDKKAILEADELVSTNKAAIKGLKAAKGLSGRANAGVGASARGWLGNNLPDYMFPDLLSSVDSSDATVQYDNAIISQALPSLKAIFGGNPTEGERKLLLDLQGSSSLPRKSREDIIDRAVAAAEERLKFNQERAAALRGGTFYKDTYSTRSSADDQQRTSAETDRTSAPGQDDLPVLSPDDARKLPPGTRFRGQDGQEYRVPMR